MDGRDAVNGQQIELRCPYRPGESGNARGGQKSEAATEEWEWRRFGLGRAPEKSRIVRTYPSVSSKVRWAHQRRQRPAVGVAISIR